MSIKTQLVFQRWGVYLAILGVIVCSSTLANDAGKRYSYLKGEAVSKVGISRMQRGSATCIDDLQWC